MYETWNWPPKFKFCLHYQNCSVFVSVRNLDNLKINVKKVNIFPNVILIIGYLDI